MTTFNLFLFLVNPTDNYIDVRIRVLKWGLCVKYSTAKMEPRMPKPKTKHVYIYKLMQMHLAACMTYCVYTYTLVHAGTL